MLAGSVDGGRRRSTSASCCRSTTSAGTCAPRSTASARRSTASPYSFEIIVVDDGSDDGSEVDLPAIEGIRLIRHSHNRGAGAARRTGTTAARGTGRRVDRRRHDVPERRDPDARQGARRLRPRRRRPAHRGGHAPLLPGAGEVVHPQAGQLPHRDRHPGPQLRAAGVPARRRDAVRAPPAGRVLVRHDADDVVPRPTATR